MTVSNTTAKNTYTGDGADTTFDFDFSVLDESHLSVSFKNTSTGVITSKTLTTDYTVSGTGNDVGRTNYSSGTITIVSTTASASEQVIIVRSVPKTQAVDYVENDTFPAETHEEALDKLTMI